MEFCSDIYVAVAYLAPLHYYARMLNCNRVVIEQHENYIKQTYRNRCMILSANGAMPLSIPVDKAMPGKCPIRDIRLSDHNPWQTLHWRSIEAAYNSSPFFEYYRDAIEPYFQQKWDFLFDFDIALQEAILSCLDMNPDITFTDSFQKEVSSDVLDLRYSLEPTTEPFQVDQNYKEISYYQVFDKKFGFISNLSIIDLLFNMGPESFLILKQMIAL